MSVTSDPEENRTTARQKPKLTAAERRARRDRRKNFMIIFINGKQKRVPRPPTIDGMPVAEFIARNAGPSWLHQTETWGFMGPSEEPSIPTDPQPPRNRALGHKLNAPASPLPGRGPGPDAAGLP